MVLQVPDQFVYIPNLNQARKGNLYSIRSVNAYQKNCFVIIPYQNPQRLKINPQYYEILNVVHYEIPQSTFATEIILVANENKKNYVEKVNKLKAEIQAGNIYEINYCMNFFAKEVQINPWEVFARLQELAKAPYAALVKIGADYVISASPELYLKKSGNYLESKPIKGTAKRGLTEAEDQDLKNELFYSHKERTENVMAVDVARNDLSHFAKRGTVKVNKLYNIETFETVHQMVSTVSCEIEGGVTFEQIIKQSFPMASMTGAPKLMAMTLIDKSESFKRNYYSGAMGMIDEHGDYSLSVLIRSIFYNIKTNYLNIAVGGAITYLSDPEKEYEECMLKAMAVFKSLNATL